MPAVHQAGNANLELPEALADLIPEELLRLPKRYGKSLHQALWCVLRLPRTKPSKEDIPSFLTTLMQPSRWEGFWKGMGAGDSSFYGLRGDADTDDSGQPK